MFAMEDVIMTKIHSDGRYDFYHSAESIVGKGSTWYHYWNIVPVGSESPESGYHGHYGRKHIEKVKGVQFPPEWRW